VYLHQVVSKNNGHIKRYRDLPDALNDTQPASQTEWRAHFHVPIAEKKFGDLESTQDAITEVLELQKKSPFTHQMEVETYTWEVIPGQLKLPIEQSIIKELNWAKSILED
jgi:hypothetical protein